MRVLIGCEESGVVREAFRKLGHDAWSCDILPARDNSPFHFRKALENVLYASDPGTWDLGIFFPPCTHLAVSGARWLTDHWVRRNGCTSTHRGCWVSDTTPTVCNLNGCHWHNGAAKRAAQKEGLAFFRMCLNAQIPRVAVENPVGVTSSLVRKPDQWIQPWQFGHGETKKTGLWLRNLPLLKPTKVVAGREQRVWSMAPGENRARDRSATYQGVADAMAAQWGA